MTQAVQRLLDTFESLSAAEKQDAVVEVLRRSLRTAPSDLPDEALTVAADALFRDLDAREAADAHV